MKIKRKTNFLKNIFIAVIFMIMLFSTVFAASAGSVELNDLKAKTIDSVEQYSILDKTSFDKISIKDDSKDEEGLDAKTWFNTPPIVTVTAPETTDDTAIITIDAYDALGNIPPGIKTIDIIRWEGSSYKPVAFKDCNGDRECTLTITETYTTPHTYTYTAKVRNEAWITKSEYFTIEFLGSTAAPTITGHNVFPAEPVTGENITIYFYISDLEEDNVFIDYSVFSQNYNDVGTIECLNNVCEFTIDSANVENDNDFLISAVPYDAKDRGSLYQFEILVGNYGLDIAPIEDVVLDEDTQTSFDLEINYTGDFDYEITQLYLIDSNSDLVLTNNETQTTIQTLNNWFGTETAVVEVCDELNKCDSEQFSIIVNSINDLPQVEIVLPVQDSQYETGDNIEFIGTATDVEDGILSNIEWTSSIDGQIEDELHFYLNTLSQGTHTITLTGCDSDGACDSDSIQIQIVLPYVNTAPWIEPTIPNVGLENGESSTFEIKTYGHDLETRQDWLQWIVTGVDENLISVDVTQGVKLVHRRFGIFPVYSYDNSNIEFTAQPGMCGTDDILITVMDEEGLIDSQWINVTVACDENNTAPWIEPVIPDMFLQFNGQDDFILRKYGHDLETPQDVLTWTFDYNESLLSLELNGEKLITKRNGLQIPIYLKNDDNLHIVAQTDACGTDSVLLTVYDEEGLNDYQYMDVTVACEEDTEAPIITLISPENNSIINTTNVTLRYNITDESNLSSSGYTLSLIGTTNQIDATNMTGEENITNLSDGTYEWFVEAEDIYGNYAESEIWRFTVNTSYTQVNETTAPNITLISPENNNITSNNDVTFQYNVTDNSNISNCSLYLDGVLNQTNSNITVNATNTFDLTNMSDGNYNWFVNCTDVYNNEGTSDVWNFTINTTVIVEPDYLIVNLTQPANGTQEIVDTNDPLQNSTLMNFTYEVSTNVDVDSCDLFIDGTNEATNTNITYTINGTQTNVFENIEVLEGNHIWYVECNNVAVPLTAQSETWNFEVVMDYTTNDITTPGVELILPLNNSILNNADIIFQYDVTDESEISSCSLYLNGILNQTDSNITVNATNTFDLTNMSDGDYTWNVECTDVYNNTGVSETWSFTIDTSVSPTEYIIVDLVLPENNSTIIVNTFNQTQTEAELNFSYNVTTNITINNCSLIIDGFESGFDDNVSYDLINELPVENSFDNISVSEGAHNWMVVCNGNTLTNVSDIWNFTLDINYIDLVLPIVTIIEPENITYFNSTVPINITATDNVAIDSVWYEVDGTNYTFTNPTNITLVDGTYTLIAYANDTSGNVGTDNVTFTIDTTGAVVYGVDIYVCDADYQKLIDVSQTAEYPICVENTGNTQTTYDLIVNNLNGATTANVNETPIIVDAGNVYQITLSVADNTQGEYNVSVTAVVNANNTINATTNITTTIVDEFTIINSDVNWNYYPFNSTDLFSNIDNTWIIDSEVYSETAGEFNAEVYVVDSYIENSLVLDLTGDDYAGADVYVNNCTIINSTKTDAYCVDSTIINSIDPRSNTTGSTIIDSEYYNSTIIYSYVEGSFVNNSYIENSTIIDLFVENATIISDIISNGTVCAIDFSWCYVADTNNTMNITNTTSFPGVVLTANPISGEEDLEVDFTATANSAFNITQNLTFNWDYGNTATAVSQSNTSVGTITYTYTNDGVYTAVVRVEDWRGTYASDSIEIRVSNEDTGSGSSGGSSGGGSSGGGIVVNQYYVNFTDENPQTISLMQYDTVLFDYNGERYSVIFTEFTTDKVVMKVKPINKELIFVPGTSRYMNLDDDLMNDIGITLEAFVEENGQRYAIVTYHSLALDRELRKETQEEPEDETPVEKILEGVVDVVGRLSSETSLKKPDIKTGLIFSGIVFIFGLAIFGIVRLVTRKKEKMRF